MASVLSLLEHRYSAPQVSRITDVAPGKVATFKGEADAVRRPKVVSQTRFTALQHSR